MEAPSEPREFQLVDADKLLNDQFSCVNMLERSVPVKLPPKYIPKRQEFVQMMLNRALGRYDYELQCIPVSYRKVKQLGSTGIIRDEDPNIYFKILVEFIVFQPVVGSRITARVEKVGRSYVGLLAHGWFNCSIAKSGGVAGDGGEPVMKLSVGDEVIVEVLRMNIIRRLLSLECRLDQVVKKAEVSPRLDTRAETKPLETTEKTAKTKHKDPDVNGSDSGIDHATLESPVMDQNTPVTKPSSSQAETVNKMSQSPKKKKHKPNEQITPSTTVTEHTFDTERIKSEKMVALNAGKSPKKDTSIHKEHLIPEAAMSDQSVDIHEIGQTAIKQEGVESPRVMKSSKKNKKHKRRESVSMETGVTEQETPKTKEQTNPVIEHIKPENVHTSGSTKSHKKRKHKRQHSDMEELESSTPLPKKAKRSDSGLLQSEETFQEPISVDLSASFLSSETKSKKKKKRSKDNPSDVDRDGSLEIKEQPLLQWVDIPSLNLDDSQMSKSEKKKKKKHSRDRDCDSVPIGEVAINQDASIIDTDTSISKSAKKKKKHKHRLVEDE